ncbi:MAG: cupin protein, partial [Frankiales bacterium]|nr:cupin protein [Frankiales bacterium]
MASMTHFTIATVAEQSPDFRRVLWTGKNTQLVIMTIPPGGEIGEEVHEDTDQILTFVSGTGEAMVSGEKRKVAQGDLV